MVLVAGWFALIHESRELHSKETTRGDKGPGWGGGGEDKQDIPSKTLKFGFLPFFPFLFFTKVSIPYSMLEKVQVVPL